ncbi:hypothetical protein V6L77_07295 [Pannonibacter sp. Pt2-lr]
MAKTAKFVTTLLIEQRKIQKFDKVLNYALRITGGLLRCREQYPYALLRQHSKDADAICEQLAGLKLLMERNAARIKQIDTKLGIIGNLMEMLSGSGGDSHILISIDGLDADGDDDAA